ncbi:MAG TPA: tRNA (adenosine(37)-N6)-threonylcarbamoyltransferase complex ATPase subunit type 1 TsaE, partial [Patescibacteria group bacterium]
MKKIITKNSRETQKLGEKTAAKTAMGSVLALTGELGSGKTTFTQGLLKGLKINGPHTSPTFVILKNYKGKFKVLTASAGSRPGGKSSKFKVIDVYHIDAYRVTAKDILNLGWKEMLAEKENIIIIEWADRIRKI